jgi:hypothetical protein
MQQLVEVAKAMRRECRVLILDEPTAALAEHEVKNLSLEDPEVPGRMLLKDISFLVREAISKRWLSGNGSFAPLKYFFSMNQQGASTSGQRRRFTG